MDRRERDSHHGVIAMVCYEQPSCVSQRHTYALSCTHHPCFLVSQPLSFPLPRDGARARKSVRARCVDRHARTSVRACARFCVCGAACLQTHARSRSRSKARPQGLRNVQLVSVSEAHTMCPSLCECMRACGGSGEGGAEKSRSLTVLCV